MRHLTMLVSFAILAQLAFAEDTKPPEKNVPQKSRDEVLRRGDMVQPLGMTSAGEQDYIADALDPPEKDNQKFWVSVVVDGDENPECEHLKNDIIKKDSLRAWIKTDDPKASFFHYQVRDVKQRPANDKWFEGIQQYITEGKYPIIVLQPPEDGTYGDPHTVINVFIGYKGDDRDLIRKVRNSIKFYIKTLLDAGKITIDVPGAPGIPLYQRTEQGAEVFIGGHEQHTQPAATRTAVTDYKNPFSGTKPNDPVQPNPKFQFPDNTPLVDPPSSVPVVDNTPATYEEMKTLEPTAPDELIVRGLKAKWSLQKFANEYDKSIGKVPTENFSSARHWAREWLDVLNVFALVAIAIAALFERKKFATLDGLIQGYSNANKP